MSFQLPSPSTISAAQVSHLLSLYQSTLEAIYKGTSRLKNPKKLSKALEDDVWRYETFPRTIRERAESGSKEKIYIEKPELERLVQWKMYVRMPGGIPVSYQCVFAYGNVSNDSTHGTHRAMLPSLIRQNDAAHVKSTTRSALLNENIFETRTSAQHPSAFSTLVKDLKGVGPATASLILNVSAPDSLPFFSDELYAWLVEPGKKSADLKLKYNKSEYQRLAEEWGDFSQRYATFGQAKANEFEKVAYVLANWGAVSQEDKDNLQKAATEGEKANSQEDEHKPKKDEVDSKLVHNDHSGRKSETKKQSQQKHALKDGPDSKAKGSGSVPKPAKSKKGGPTYLITPGPQTAERRKELHASMEKSGNRRSKRLKKD